MANKKLKKKDYQQALQAMFEQAQGVKGWDTRYVPKSLDPVDHSSLEIKLIAYYLPQFHPVPENDHWWGKGFTEWTNVTKAVPQFLGHYQPHLPGELGFYDLRLPESLRAQAALARHYGVHGFCIHHYWFGGRRILERPLEVLLENPDIDINFCLCWANENWCRRWDGLEEDILLAQSHSPQDDIAFIDSLMPAFKDERYIKVDGKPVLVVYRASLLPDARETAKRWRAHLAEHGFPGIHLVAATSFDIVESESFGFDATVEFPPHKFKVEPINSQYVVLNPDYTGKIYDYGNWKDRWNSQPSEGRVHYRGVMPSWDNEARRPGNGFSYVNATPVSYASWLNNVCQETAAKPEAQRFVFVNAWNEWAEGAHLEPDRRNGYAYLHATASVLQRFRKPSAVFNRVTEIQRSFVKRSDFCVAVHLYYSDLSAELIARLREAPSIDVHLSMMQDVSTDVLELWLNSGLNFYPTLIENRGRDIRSFLTAFSGFIQPRGYELFCKVHTKKSLHRLDGDVWRSSLYDSLISEIAIDQLKSSRRVGLLAPLGSIMDLSVPQIHLGNLEWLNALLEILGRPDLADGYRFSFSAGSMFWGRTEAFSLLRKFDDLIDSFELEVGQMDGTLAHAFERIFGLLVNAEGYEMAEAGNGGAVGQLKELLQVTHRKIPS